MSNVALDLIDRINRVFPTSPMPSMTLCQAILADQSLSRSISDEEWDAEGEKDNFIKWTDVAESMLIEAASNMAHLDEESFVYYLGAFLRFAINHLNDNLACIEGGNPVDSVIFYVTYRDNSHVGTFKKLTDEQINVVIDFLHLVVEGRPDTYGVSAKKALERYWETPESRRKTIIYLPGEK